MKWILPRHHLPLNRPTRVYHEYRTSPRGTRKSTEEIPLTELVRTVSIHNQPSFDIGLKRYHSAGLPRAISLLRPLD
jgi:hypothetical protein